MLICDLPLRYRLLLNPNHLVQDGRHGAGNVFVLGLGDSPEETEFRAGRGKPGAHGVGQPLFVPHAFHDAAGKSACSEDCIHQLDREAVGVGPLDPEVSQGHASLSEGAGDNVDATLVPGIDLGERREIERVGWPVAEEALDLLQHFFPPKVTHHGQHHVIRMDVAAVVGPEIVRLDDLHVRWLQRTTQGMCLGIEHPAEFARQKLRWIVCHTAQILDRASLGYLEWLGIKGRPADHLGKDLKSLICVLCQSAQRQGNRLAGSGRLDRGAEDFQLPVQ